MQLDLKWDVRFLEIAKTVSFWSKDPSSKCGAVAVNTETRNPLSFGYNGLPRGVNDTEERLNNRELKYTMVVHAELNCILNAALNGVSLRGADFYVYGPIPVCNECAKAIIQSGIKRVITPKFENVPEKWKKANEITKMMFREAMIETLEIDF